MFWTNQESWRDKYFGTEAACCSSGRSQIKNTYPRLEETGWSGFNRTNFYTISIFWMAQTINFTILAQFVLANQTNSNLTATRHTHYTHVCIVNFSNNFFYTLFDGKIITHSIRMTSFLITVHVYRVTQKSHSTFWN